MSIVFACNNANNNEDRTIVQDIHNKTQISTPESEDVEDENEQESLESILSKLSDEQRNVYDDMMALIKWYIENRDTLFSKRERIVESSADYVASINLAYVEDYLNFLKQEGNCCVSKLFILEEEKYWQSAYNETKEEQIIWEDGPDPWCFEADPIFNGHDWPNDFEKWKEGEKDKYRELEPADIEVKGDTAILYFNSKRKLVKENEKWKLIGWFAKN